MKEQQFSKNTISKPFYKNKEKKGIKKDVGSYKKQEC